jgi:hypothetical protein
VPGRLRRPFIVHYGHLAWREAAVETRAMEEEMGIYREEVILIMEALADIRHNTRRVINLLDENDETEEEEDS